MRVFALFQLNSYMTNRTQQVQIGNALSDICPVKYGVPQGSILAPLLFTLYDISFIHFLYPFIYDVD
jgi:hypothetical protein